MNEVEDDDRMAALARILAAAILRLRVRAALPTESEHLVATKNLPESTQNCLDVGQETALTVTHGLTVSETSTKERIA